MNKLFQVVVDTANKINIYKKERWTKFNVFMDII